MSLRRSSYLSSKQKQTANRFTDVTHCPHPTQFILPWPSWQIQ